jgi:predicted regulator of Ras-like GTPase activity (Roadblock/LC7/MglB family)
MKDIIDPYLELEGVESAALASREGFLVAASGNGDRNFESLAAHAASMLAIAKELAAETGQQAPKVISLNLGSRGIILAPLNKELFLILTGDRAILDLTGESTAAIWS